VLQRAIAELRDVLPRGTRIVVAATRPRVCRLGGALADGVLLNWMLPEQLLDARRWVQEGADEAGRAAPLVGSYVRVAFASGSRERLRAKERRYRSIDEGHRKHFAAMNVSLGSVGVAASTPQEMREGPGGVPVDARPPDRTGTRGFRFNLPHCRRRRRGAVSAVHPPARSPATGTVTGRFRAPPGTDRRVILRK
jgi:alkanesulfonate monooxygenase SsuD/methylene tetrahydromethanopterin reductase-like flavin-dependent oxidoreductase (luciferase family)